MRATSIRPATLDDLPVIASWIRSKQDCAHWAGPAVQYPLRLDSLAESFKFSPETSYCMQADARLAGYGQLRSLVDGRGHLARLIVAPELRGAGLGRALVLALLAMAAGKGLEPVGLWVEPANEVAVCLYRKLGFTRAEAPNCVIPSPGSWYMVSA